MICNKFISLNVPQILAPRSEIKNLQRNSPPSFLIFLIQHFFLINTIMPFHFPSSHLIKFIPPPIIPQNPIHHQKNPPSKTPRKKRNLQKPPNHSPKNHHTHQTSSPPPNVLSTRSRKSTI